MLNTWLTFWNQFFLSFPFVAKFVMCVLTKAAGSPSLSTENLPMASRLSRQPSLPRNQQRNRSGIPVAHRELPKGCLFN